MNSFCLTKHTITSSDPQWSRNYLKTRHLRITSILSPQYGNDFWQHYAQVYTEFTKAKKLLFRAKVIKDNSVEFMQIWSNQGDAISFATLANQNRSPLKSLVEIGFSVSELYVNATYEDLCQYISEIEGRPHILQHVDSMFLKPHMIIGDPIKKGQGHLPFPENNIIDDKNILFASLKLPEINRNQALKEMNEISESEWIWDDYRATSMLPIMTKDGKSSHHSLFNIKKEGDHIWTSNAPKTLINYFEDHIFNWITCRPRIVILKTDPTMSIKEHIDCQPFEFGLRQLKFRYVLSGDTSSLYFLTETGNVHAPETNLPFLIDGSWPHGMLNNSNKQKITVCLGAPWNGEVRYPEFETTLLKEDVTLPDNYKDYFKKTT